MACWSQHCQKIKCYLKEASRFSMVLQLRWQKHYNLITSTGRIFLVQQKFSLDLSQRGGEGPELRVQNN
jgi:hypothetical protein